MQSMRSVMYRLTLGTVRAAVPAVMRLAAFIAAMTVAMPVTVVAETKAAQPLAEITGGVITDADLERSLGAKLAKLEEQIYTLKRAELENLIAQRLLAQEAARRRVSYERLARCRGYIEGGTVYRARSRELLPAE